jgi:hypothetical protein
MNQIHNYQFSYLKLHGMGETKKPKEGEIVVPLNRDLVNAGFDLIIDDPLP